MKREGRVGVFFVLFVLIASLWVSPAEAINHKTKITNTTSLGCSATLAYGLKNLLGERYEKEHQFSWYQPNASFTFETGAKCPAGLRIWCQGRLVERCINGRDVEGAAKCAGSCWSSDWFIRDDGKGGAKLTKE